MRGVRACRRPDGPEAISISKSSLLSAAARLLSWQRSLSPEPDTPPADAASAPVLDEAGSAHLQRIAEIQAAFVGGQVLASAHRQFVLEGTLVKVCRKANKARRFFLFNDLLVYGTPLPTKRLGNQTILPLSYISIVSLPDEPPGAPSWHKHWWRAAVLTGESMAKLYLLSCRRHQCLSGVFAAQVVCRDGRHAGGEGAVD